MMMLKKTIILVACLAASACATGREGALPRPQEGKACPSNLSNEQELKLQMVQDLVAQGKLYAGLAQLDALPEQSPPVIRQRGDIQRRLGLSQEAGKNYEALTKTCMAGYGEHGLGLLAAEQGDYATAEKYLKTAAAILPTNYRIRNDLGMAYMYNAEDEQAHFELMTALELGTGSDMLPALNLLSLSLVRGDERQMNELVGRFQFSGDQVADVMKHCSQIATVRKSHMVVVKPGESLATASAPAVVDDLSCQWKLVDNNPRLSSVIKGPKAK